MNNCNRKQIAGGDLEIDHYPVRILTMGKERRKAAAQVMALADVTSLMKPARIPPTIPPISNSVDKSAEDFAPRSSPSSHPRLEQIRIKHGFNFDKLTYSILE